jgi:hypothetical protein
VTPLRCAAEAATAAGLVKFTSTCERHGSCFRYSCAPYRCTTCMDDAGRKQRQKKGRCCERCNTVRSRSEFDGRKLICRSCDTPKAKACLRCKQILPLLSFASHRRVCRACDAATERTCSSCAGVFPLKSFGTRTICGACHYARNADDHKRRSAARRALPGKREEAAAYMKGWLSRPENKKKKRELGVQWRSRPENRSQLRRHKLTPEQFAALGSVCAVCGSDDRLSVDHDHSCCPGKHSCGKCVRGLLCGNCNSAEGYLQGDPDRAEKLAQYIERHASRVLPLQGSEALGGVPLSEPLVVPALPRREEQRELVEVGPSAGQQGTLSGEVSRADSGAVPGSRGLLPRLRDTPGVGCSDAR